MKCSKENPKLLVLFAFYSPVLTQACVASDMRETGVRVTSLLYKSWWITDYSCKFHVWYLSDSFGTFRICVHIAFCSGQNNTGGLLEWSACGVREKTLNVGFDWLKGLTRIRHNIHQQHWVSGRYIPTNGLFCQDRQTQPEQVLLYFLVYQADPIMSFYVSSESPIQNGKFWETQIRLSYDVDLFVPQSLFLFLFLKFFF